MTRFTWEYLTEPVDVLTNDQLNELGADGWELVTIHDGTAIFKRPGPDFRERITIEQRQQLGAQRNEGDH